jgi:Fur family transcriptional regulator, zinc uptake regulator
MKRTTRTPINRRKGQAKHAEKILATLRGLGRPASAYDIQAQLSGKEHLAPPTIYRVLDRLIEDGSVHKVESLNAFVACSHDCHREPSVFAICDRCGTVSELNDPGIGKVVEAWSRAAEFSVTNAALELHGLCTVCNRGLPA